MKPEIQEIQETLQKQVEDATKGLVTQLNEHKGRISDLSEQLDSEKAANSEQKTAFQESAERLVRVEDDLQKASDRLARFSSGQSEEAKSLFQMVEEKADQLKAYRGGSMMLFDNLNVKTVTSAASSAGPLKAPMEEMTPIMSPQHQLWLRNLIPAFPISTDTLRYRKELVRTNNAAIQQNEGDTKPQSTITFEDATATVETIAHWDDFSRQVVADVPLLTSIIEDMLRYGLNYKEQDEMLHGTDVAGSLAGIVPQATAYATAGEAATDTRIDRIRRAILQSESGLYPASAIAMNNADWAEIEMTKTDDKAYLFANPVNSTQPRLWGLPVLSSTTMTANTFLTGGFSTGASIYDREETTVRFADQDGTDFVKNMMKILVEKRTMIVVKRPATFISGNFTFA